jgi:hypothetical protein
VLAALVLAGPYVDERIRVSGPATYARLGLEAGALVAAGVVSPAAVDFATSADEATWFAVYLTLPGATVSAMALLRPDRRMVGWLGGFLLAAASWVRLADLGVDAPEAYTLPSGGPPRGRCRHLRAPGEHDGRAGPRAAALVLSSFKSWLTRSHPLGARRRRLALASAGSGSTERAVVHAGDRQLLALRDPCRRRGPVAQGSGRRPCCSTRWASLGGSGCATHRWPAAARGLPWPALKT